MQNSHDSKELLKAIRDGRMTPDRAGVYWNKDERNQLEHLYVIGLGISEIALTLQRTEQAVVQQLLIAWLLTPPSNRRGKRSSSESRCLCPGCQIKDCEHCPRRKEKNK